MLALGLDPDAMFDRKAAPSGDNEEDLPANRQKALA
jgi:hypothetical protein